MKTYHKIQTVFLRDPATNMKTLLNGQYSLPEFKLLENIDWVATEKIDGTNIRVIWQNGKIEFRGKTDNAMIPEFLLDTLKEKFSEEKMSTAFENSDNEICLYGEGYGRKIQKGGNYLPDENDFILFDIKIGPWWLTRQDCESIAKKLDIKIVPIIGITNLPDAVDFVKKGFKSTISHNKDYMAEGLILKPVNDLFARNGQRIITKIKHIDFK